jgi:N-methylhydantoinase B
MAEPADRGGGHVTGPSLAARAGQAVDPVTVEVIRSGLISIVREMSVTLTRTAYSTIIRDVHDFSCVLFDRHGRLIAQAEGIPSFNGGMSFALGATAAKFPLGSMREGDVYLSNDPYFGEGASFHKNDINVVMPIFVGSELVMLSASKAHYLDIGGKDPGSYSPDARNSFQEGLTVPPVKLYDAGTQNEAIVDIFFANVRMPNLERGDLAAQLAAGKTAEARAIELVHRFGDVLDAAVEHLLDHAERIVRAAIEEIADGTYEIAGFHDGDGTTEEPIPIRVAVTIDGGEITIDTTGSAPQRSSSSGNCHWLTTVAASRETVMFLADTSLGANVGSYRPIWFIAPPGSVYRPVAPAPTTTGTADMSVRLIELILRALAPALPDKVIAGTFGTVSALSLSGNDPVTGKEFVHFSPYAGGWGGRAEVDGNSAMVSLLSGDNYNIPCEVMETRFPALLAQRYSLREGSGGAGRQRGGWGVAYDYRTLVDAELSVALDHYAYPPHGLFGGQPGRGSELVIAAGTPEQRILHQAAGVRVVAGTIVSHRTAGGGGYGDPFERDPTAVADDVRNGLITPGEAHADYGVVLKEPRLAVDTAATAQLRSEHGGGGGEVT